VCLENGSTFSDNMVVRGALLMQYYYLPRVLAMGLSNGLPGGSIEGSIEGSIDGTIDGSVNKSSKHGTASITELAEGF
jgi:hypothetical protein